MAELQLVTKIVLSLRLAALWWRAVEGLLWLPQNRWLSQEITCNMFFFSASQVRDPGDIIRWEASEAYQVFLTSYCFIQLQSFRYQEYLGFIIAIGDAVKGKKLTEEVFSSDVKIHSK